MSWTYRKDSELPDSIRNDLETLRQVSFCKPSDHNVTHTKDSHEYTLYRRKLNGYAVKVSHGGGIYWLTTIHENTSALFIRNNIETLTGLQIWELLDMLFVAYEDGRKAGYLNAEVAYRTAFAEGRLKKRKLPKQNMVKVWIEPAKGK